MRETNKPYTEYFIVPTGDQNLVASGNLFGTGTSVNIADGQLGLIFGRSYNGNDYGHFVEAAETVDDAPVVKLVQGTSNSADFGSLYGWHYDIPAFVATPEIRANTIQRVSSEIHNVGSYGSVALQITGTPANNTRYPLHLKMRSVRKDRDYGGNVDQFSVESVTGSSASVAEVLTDWGHKINVRSTAFGAGNGLPPANLRMIAFGIDVSGGDGTAIGTAGVGDSIDVFTYNGTTYSITVDKVWLETMNKWIANTSVTATSTIEVLDVTSLDSVDMLMVSGLAHDTARAFDDIYNTRIRVEAEIGSEIAGTETEAAPALDDLGSGRLLKIWFNQRAFGQTGNTALAGFSDTLLLPLEYIDESKRYTVHSIDTYNEDVINNDHIHNQTRIWIIMEATDDSATATVADGLTVTTADTTTLSDLNSILGAWLLSNDHPFQVNGQSTTTTLFV